MLYRQFRICITNASGKAHTPKVARILRLPCVKGAVALATEGLFFTKNFAFLTIPPSRRAVPICLQIFSHLHKGGQLADKVYFSRQG